MINSPTFQLSREIKAKEYYSYPWIRTYECGFMFRFGSRIGFDLLEPLNHKYSRAERQKRR